MNTSAGCAAVGPPECATLASGDAAACVPRWCGDWRDPAGNPCAAGSDNCDVFGRACTVAELSTGQGCPAGFAPEPAVGSACIAAGDLAPGGGADEHLLPAEAPPLVAVPPAGVVGCVVGSPGEADCLAYGLEAVAPLCPAGFVVDPSLPLAQGGLLRCSPDPARCTDLPFGLVGALPADTLYVDASAGDDGGPGTLTKPFATLVKAVAVAKPLQTVAIQSGAYSESVTVDKPVTLRGRCAHGVHWFGNLSTPAITFAMPVGEQGTANAAELSLHGIGRGIEVSGGGAVQLDGIWLGGVQTAGILVKAANVNANRLVIDGTVPNTDKLFGDGVAVTGGSLRIHQGRIGRTFHAGASAHAGSKLELSSVVIDAVEPHAKAPEFGYGISAQKGAQVALERVWVHGASVNGIFVSDPGTQVTATDLLVDATRNVVQSAVGIHVQLGASVALTRTRISQNLGGGIALQHAGTTGKLTDVLADGNQFGAGEGGGGGGIAFFSAAQGELERIRSSANQRYGVLVSGAGTTVRARRVLVDGTLTVQEKAMAGQGIAVLDGARATLDGARSTGNQDGAIQVVGTGSQLRAHRIAADHTQALAPVLLSGWGLDVRDGAQVWLRRARLVDNQTLGMFLHGADARVDGVGVLVAGTQPRPKTANFGRGVNVQFGARLNLAGSSVRENRDIGMSAFGAGPQSWVGVVVSGTAHAPGQQFGVGVSLNESTAVTSLVSTVVRGNHSVGVVVNRALATVHGSVIADTAKGAYPKGFTAAGKATGHAELADGLHADVAQELVVRDSFVVGNSRAGLLAKGAPKVSVLRTLVGGGHFGLAATSGPLPAVSASLVLAAGQAQASDSGLAVGAAPELVDVSAGK